MTVDIIFKNGKPAHHVNVELCKVIDGNLLDIHFSDKGFVSYARSQIIIAILKDGGIYEIVC